MPRRTKIVATLGPATDSEEKMKGLINAGVDLIRINLSHGTHKEHESRIRLALSCARELKKTIGILVDLQGPKIRIARFADPKGIFLREGELFILDANWPADQGNTVRVGLDYRTLPQEIQTNDQLLLDDGRIVLQVTRVQENEIVCVVQAGGWLLSHKGVNRKGGGLSAPTLTEKDKKDIEWIAQMQVDYVALSFPKCAADIQEAKRLIELSGSSARIIAKIERAEAMAHIDEIIDASDAVMVARGDLGVELGYADLPAIQKDIINRTRMRNKAVITATQMMESMVKNPIPTRAEVSDVANAILDGTDAVMLSAETATGDFPIKVVSILDEICICAEKHRVSRLSLPEMQIKFERHDKAIAMAAMYIANHVPIKAIVALTESGSTPLWMSRVRSGIPVYALSRHRQTAGRVTLFRGVYPVEFDLTQYKIWEISRYALGKLVEERILQPSDKVILTKGDILGVDGKANTLKILTAEAIH